MKAKSGKTKTMTNKAMKKTKGGAIKMAAQSASLAESVSASTAADRNLSAQGDLAAMRARAKR